MPATSRFFVVFICAFALGTLCADPVLITTSTTIDPAPRTLNASGTTAYLVADGATLVFANGLGASGTDGGVFAYNGSASGMVLNFAPAPAAIAGNGAVRFQNNRADKHGGAIGITNNRVLLTLANAILELNSTGSGNGGALITNGTSRIHNAVFASNTAGASGGAFYGTGYATITQSHFDGNTAATHGGAVYRGGNTLILTGGTFSNNTAGTNGGAIYNTGANTSSFLTDVVFADNTANAGGALFANSGTVVVERARFKGNVAASSHGGAVNASTAASVVLADVTFTDNTAAGNGGAIFTNRGTLTIRATTSATSTGNKSSGTTGASGGFLYITGTNAIVNFDITGPDTRYVIGDANAADRTLDTIADGGSSGAAIGHVINKTGDGALVLNADNSNYRSAINITGGALLLGNAGAKLNASAYTVGGGALGGIGALSGSAAFLATSTLFVDGGLLTIVTTATTGVTLRDGAAIGGSGTLVLAGENNTLQLDAGAIAATVGAGKTLTLAAALTGGGVLEKRDSGTLLLANADSTFTGGVMLAGGTLAISNAAQLGATTNEIRFASASGATLRVDANEQTLANTITLAPASSGIIDTRTNTLALSGALASAADSTLTKTGAGALIFLDADATAFLGTLRVAQGSMRLATAGGSTAPATLTLGGALALENATLAFTLYDGVASDGYLESDRIHAVSLNITGANTIDVGGHIQSGTYNLGNLAALAPAVTLTVDGAEQLDDFRRKAVLKTSGSLLLVETQVDMSRALAWTGGTGATANLWTGAHVGQWTDTGTVTRFADGDRVTFQNTAAPIDIPTAVTVSDIIVSGNATTTFTGDTITADAASVVTGTLAGATGRLRKTGAGTLAFENAANTFHGGITLEGGVIAFTRAAQLDTPAINITGNGTLSLAASAEVEITAPISIAPETTAAIATADGGTLVLRGAITGSGALTKAGAGTLTLAASADYRGATLVQTGTLRAAAANVFARDSRHTVHSGAALDLAGHDQAVASLTSNRGLVNLSTAHLAIAGDYAAARGTLTLDLLLADGAEPRAGSLAISGSASGQTTVRIQLTDTRATADRSPLPASTPALITAGAASPGDAFALAGGSRFVVGAYDYLFLPDNAAAAREWRLVLDNFSPEIPAVAGTDAIALQAGRAAFDTLLARLDDLRISENPRARNADLWAGLAYRRDRANQTVYTGASIEIAGLQAGAGLVRKTGSRTFRLGLFADLLDAEMELSRGTRTKADIRGAGLYAALAGQAWNAAVIVRGARAGYDISAPGASTFSTDGDDIGATIQIGRAFGTKSGWRVEPLAAFEHQCHDIDNTTDRFGRMYEIADFTSLAARLAVAFDRAWPLKRGHLIPRVRLSALHEFDGETRMAIAGDAIKADFGGLSAELDAGLIWRGGGRWAASASVTARAGGKFDGYTLRLGADCAW
ncbi:autotransporter-associated beta strand protein/predicted outer membrane repeat protein [Ereboglobus sp. PH5-5]|uniref:beta strand repeat-containing protein n=1 Tax=Ereboglobus sp. PH5-5 TaxID=2940529 RepID=UPI002405CC2B|nr:autotransporter domain-containing protein [Ereboglobus sp. PH5-5]MDF9833653.1 autotransporter-associated beta strand protein/predicted outer membrane repeat protein [Ereboglobus sp. PH5-5]